MRGDTVSLGERQSFLFSFRLSSLLALVECVCGFEGIACLPPGLPAWI